MNRVLIVDDEELICRALARLIAPKGYECSVAVGAQEAQSLLRESSFDLVLCDVNMPHMSGIDLVRGLLCDHPDTAVIMITAIDDPAVAQLAVDVGAYGYVIKPFMSNEVLINIANAMRRRTLEIESRQKRARLEQAVQERTRELETAVEELRRAGRALHSSHEETIRRLSKAAEFRDNETAQHIDRMSRYCGLLAARLAMPSAQVELISLASSMHDVGKIGIPDHVLLKPGRLTPEEFTVMKQHAEIGRRILAGAESKLLETAAVIAWTHHEKIDGSGYPRGIKGADIPIEGRVTAICDVFDALTSKRVYKDAMTVEEALQILRDGRGSHFDARIVDVFLESIDDVLTIMKQYTDH